MSIAKRCDRCGRLYDYYGREKDTDKYNICNGIMECNIDPTSSQYYNNSLNDLCPECMESYMDWWGKTNNTDEKGENK